MAERWFRLPMKTDDMGRSVVDLKGHDVVGHAGNSAHPNGAPQRVAIVEGDASTLDALANEPGVVELDSLPTQALNQITGEERTADEWRERIYVGAD